MVLIFTLLSLEMPVDSETVNLPAEYIQFCENRSTILENVKEVIVQYIPFEQYNALWIMGDFTGWEPKQMNRHKDVFSYPSILITGFKYYYCMSFRDQMIVDMNHEYETNPLNFQVNNYIDLKDLNKKETIPFDYKVHGGILSEARKNYTKARMGNINEVYLLEKLVEFSTRLKERSSYIYNKRQELGNKLQKFYEYELFYKTV